MDYKSFSIGEVLRTGWEKFKEHPFTWIATMLVFFLLWISHAAIDLYMRMGDNGIDISQNFNSPVLNIPQTGWIGFGILILYLIIQFGLSLGLFSMSLKAADGLPVKFVDLFSQFKNVFKYFFSYILYGLVIIIGLFLFIFPAAIWASKFALYPYFIIDRGAGPIEALKLSSQATKGYKWDVFAYMIITYIIGVLSLLIGLLVLGPILVIGWAAIYRRLERAIEPAV